MATQTEETRECRTCHQVKPLSEYIVYRKNNKTYQHYQCKLCYTRAQYPRRKLLAAEFNALKTAGQLPADQVRKCQLCQENFPLSEFRALDYRCKRCNRIRQRTARRLPHNRFTHAKGIAKRRGIVFELTHEE